MCAQSVECNEVPRKDIRIGSKQSHNWLTEQNSLYESEKVVEEDDFEKLKLIGKGSFGVVYLVKHIETGAILAMKKMRKDLCLKAKAISGIKFER